jgi:hypothetical protein
MPGRPSACRLPGWGASNHRPRAPVRRGPQETPLVGCRDRRASCELDPWWTPLLRALTGECLPLAQRATGSPWGLIIGQCSDSGHRIRPLGIGAATSGPPKPGSDGRFALARAAEGSRRAAPKIATASGFVVLWPRGCGLALQAIKQSECFLSSFSAHRGLGLQRQTDGGSICLTEQATAPRVVELRAGGARGLGPGRRALPARDGRRDARCNAARGAVGSALPSPHRVIMCGSGCNLAPT